MHRGQRERAALGVVSRVDPNAGGFAFVEDLLVDRHVASGGDDEAETERITRGVFAAQQRDTELVELVDDLRSDDGDVGAAGE